MLVACFEEQEVKDVIWDCDSQKGPDLDDINFIFLECFWKTLKGKVMRLVNEFHSNGSITKRM